MIQSKNMIVPLALALSVLGQGAWAEDLRLEEVIVMAQKRSERLQDVPVSVSVIDQSTLQNRDFRNTQEIAALAPNVRMYGSNGDAQLVLGMRGVMQSDYSPNGTGSVALYVDEVYMGPTPLSSGVQLFDLQRIEMVLGPQGTLYGRNATGGAVNLITRLPAMDGLTSGYVEVGTGNYGSYKVSGAFDTQLAANTGARIAAVYRNSDGLVENKFAGQGDPGEINEGAIRATLLHQGESLDAILRLYKARTRANHTSILMLDNGDPAFGPAYGFTGYSRDGLEFHETESNRVEEKRFDLDSVSLTLRYDISDDLSLISITSWDDGVYDIPADDDGSPWNLLEDNYYAETQQVSQDLRLDGDADNGFNYILGVYYASDETGGSTVFRWLADFAATANDCTVDFFTGCYYRNAYEQRRSSAAGYVHVNYPILDALNLSAGIRYTADSIEMRDFHSYFGQAFNSFGTEADGPPLGPLGIDVARDEQKDRNWSGKIGLDWRVGESTLIFANYSTGYRGSAYNGFAFVPSEFSSVEPEELFAWEAGFKTSVGGGRAHINGSAFTYTYENQQFLVFNEDGTQRLVNAGESDISGLELQVIGRLTEGLTVSAGLGLLDAEYSQLDYQGIDLSGNRLPATPDVNANLTLDYDVWSNQSVAVDVSYSASYASRQYLEVFNGDDLAQSAYTLHNLRFNVVVEDRHAIGLFVNNLTDEEYIVFSGDLRPLWGRFMFRGVPRTFGVDYRYEF